MRWKYFALPLCLVGFACASTQETPKTQETKTAASAEPGGPKQTATAKASEEIASADEKKDGGLVCRMEHVLGSNMRRRVCRSQEQMERERREAQDVARRAGRVANGTNED